MSDATRLPQLMRATPARRRLHRLRLLVEGIAAFAIIGTALVVGSAGLLLPWLVSHPERVQDFLSARLEQPVVLARVDGAWTVAGPVFTLHDVKLGDPRKGDPFRIERAELAIDFYAWLKEDVGFSEFRIVGLAIDAARSPDGSWRVARLAGRDGGTDTGGRAEVLLDLVTVSVRNARLSLTDAATGRRLQFARVDGNIVNTMLGRRFGGVVWAEKSSPPLRFACDLDRRESGRCYLEGEGLEPARWLVDYPLTGIVPVSGTVDAKVWFDWAQGALQGTQIEVQSENFALRGTAPVVFGDGDAIEPRFSLSGLRVAARWQRRADGWDLDVIDWRDAATEAAPTTSLRLARRDVAGKPHYHLAAPRVELAYWLPFVALAHGAPEKLRSVLYENSPRGALREVEFDYRDGKFDLAARVESLSLQPGYKRPGFDALSGRLLADRDAIVLIADPEQQLALDYEGVFRTVIPLTLHHGTFAVLRTPDGWKAEATAFDLDAAGIGFTGELALWYEHEGKRPTMDATVRVKPDGLMTALKLLWPINVMRPKTVQWLDRAIVSGVLAGGDAVIRGDLDYWPFRDDQGRFEAHARFTDLDLIYHPEWPRARVHAGEATFINGGMRVDVDAAEIAGNHVGETRAEIPSFREPVIELRGEAEGSGEALLGFLRASPLDAKFGGYLLGVTIGGRGIVEVDLTIPLAAHLGETNVDGSVRLVDADIADAKWALNFARANGRMRFTEDGFAADDLAVLLDGDPAELSLLVGEFTSSESNQTEASLRGDLPLRSVMSSFDVLDPYWVRFPGRSEWTLDLTIPKSGTQPASTTTLVLRSDLVGTAIDLPAPLRKDATSSIPFTMSVDLPARGGRLAMRLGGLAKLVARLPGPAQEFAADLAFGAAEPGAAPARGLHVHGTLPVLDLSGWGELAGSGGGGVPIDVAVEAGELIAAGRAFHDVAIGMAQSPGDYRIDVSGPEIKGHVVLPRGDKVAQGVTAEFERLYLPVSPPGEQRSVTQVNPAKLPPLHLWVKDLRYDEARLGEARIEAFPRGAGLHFERIETVAPELQIRARGDWMLERGVDRTHLDMTFTAKSLGKMLDALGFEGLIEGGPTLAHLDGTWPGSPGQFALAKMDGTLAVTVGKGRILDVEPGAGRLFGLISFSSIPRRLSLDFSDFFRSGFAFDSIKGNFAIRDGNAHTKDLLLKGPSADIDIRGRTGLAQRDYDQRLHVVPHVGSVLPWVGAIAGGPVGAAAGLVVQNVLPIKRAASARYKVQGSWEKPQITLIAKRRGPRAGDAPALPPEDKPG